MSFKSFKQHLLQVQQQLIDHGIETSKWEDARAESPYWTFTINSTYDVICGYFEDELKWEVAESNSELTRFNPFDDISIVVVKEPGQVTTCNAILKDW